MRQAPWAKELAEKGLGEQRTVVGMAPGAPASQPIQPYTMRSRYTGTGPDGVLQPGRPVDMVQTDRGPRMLHEGEIQSVGPDGRMTVVPAHAVPQQTLQAMERAHGIPGYASGTPNWSSLFSGNGRSSQPVSQTFSGFSKQPGALLEPVSPSAAGRDFNLSGATSGASSGITPEQYATNARQAMGVSDTRIPVSVTQPGMNNAPDFQLTPPPAPKPIQVQTMKSSVAMPPPANPNPAPPPPGPVDPIAAHDEALGNMVDIMQGDSPVFDTMHQRAVTDQAARDQWRRASMKQDMAQNPNLTEGARNSIMASTMAEQSAAGAQMQGDIAQRSMEIAADMAPIVESVTRAINTENYGRGMTVATAALASNDPNVRMSGLQAMNNLNPGLGIDFTQFAGDLDAGAFSTGVANVGDLVERFGSNVDGALAVAQGDGTLQALGMDPNQFRLFYASQNVSALDRTLGEIDNIQGVDDETRQFMKDTIIAIETGEAFFEQVPEFELFDAQGNSQGTFVGQAAASTAMQGHSDWTMQATGKTKILPINQATGTVTPPEDPANLTEIGKAAKMGYEHYSDDLYNAYKDDGGKDLPTRSEWSAWYRETGKYLDPQSTVWTALEEGEFDVRKLDDATVRFILENPDKVPVEVMDRINRGALSWDTLASAPLWTYDAGGHNERGVTPYFLTGGMYTLPDGQTVFFDHAKYNDPTHANYIFRNAENQLVTVTLGADGSIFVDGERIPGNYTVRKTPNYPK